MEKPDSISEIHEAEEKYRQLQENKKFLEEKLTLKLKLSKKIFDWCSKFVKSSEYDSSYIGQSIK